VKLYYETHSLKRPKGWTS